MEDGGHRHAPASLPPGMTRYTLCMRLGGPPGPFQTDVGDSNSPLPVFDPWTVPLVASSCTDYADPFDSFF